LRRSAAVAAAVATLVVLAGGAPPALADVNTAPQSYPDCVFSEATLSSKILVVGTSHERSVQARVKASGCGTFAVVDGGEEAYDIPFLHFGSYVGGYLYSNAGDPTDLGGTPAASPYALRNSAAGKKLVGAIELPDGTTRAFPGPTLTLKRKTAARIDAPSRVKKNKRFYVNGGLTSADWDAGEYGQAFKKTAKLQSRVNTGKWKTLKTVKTLNGNVEGGNLYALTKIKKRRASDGPTPGTSGQRPLPRTRTA
jgi:hypothetical protein